MAAKKKPSTAASASKKTPPKPPAPMGASGVPVYRVKSGQYNTARAVPSEYVSPARAKKLAKQNDPYGIGAKQTPSAIVIGAEANKVFKYSPTSNPTAKKGSVSGKAKKKK